MIKAKMFLCIPLIFFTLLSLNRETRAKDETMESGATGCWVAKAAIDRTVGCHIFNKKDNFIYARASLVSKFGTDVWLSGGIGIWMMTKKNLQDAKDSELFLVYPPKM